jgi:2-polyprenyl-6-methoxyphenol hydroxylase-like FAD-dependent oxidoreductase
MEDAAALGVVLERDVRSEEVRDRLELYQQIRKGRADRLQQYTRLAGEDLAPGEPMKFNMMEYVAYNFGHDEYDNSSKKLKYWRQSCLKQH